jgi:hypothetical protein
LPRRCSVCLHKAHEEINAALIANGPLRTIADRWSGSKTALIRHKEDHLPAVLVKAEQVKQVVERARCCNGY